MNDEASHWRALKSSCAIFHKLWLHGIFENTSYVQFAEFSEVGISFSHVEC